MRFSATLRCHGVVATALVILAHCVPADGVLTDCGFAQDPFFDGLADPFANSDDIPDLVRGKTPDQAVRVLKPMLLDNDQWVAGKAALELSELPREFLDKLFDEFLADAHSDDAKRRGDAVVSLSRLCGAIASRSQYAETRKRVSVALLELLKDTNPRVRLATIQTLAHCFDAQTITPEFENVLLLRLKDENSRVREVAARGMGKIGLIERLPNLIERFSDSDSGVRAAAAHAAGQLARVMMVPSAESFETAKARGNADWLTRLHQFKRLVDANYVNAVRGLSILAQDIEPEVRLAATKVLDGRWEDYARLAETPLLKLASDRDPAIRTAALTSMRCLGAQAGPTLMAALRDDDKGVVESALASLADIFYADCHGRNYDIYETRSQVLPFVETLETVDVKPVDAITRETAETIAKAFADPNFIARNRAGSALESMGPNARFARVTIANQLEDPHGMIRSFAVNALRAIGPPARDQLAKIAEAIRRYPKTPEYFSDDDSEWNVQEAIEAIDVIATDSGDFKPMLPVLLHSLGHEDPNVASRAAIALARRPEIALPFLLKALEDTNPIRRRSAVFAIAHLGESARQAIPKLIDLLEDADPDVVWNAAQAIAHIPVDANTTAPRVAKLLKHPDLEIRVRAAETLVVTRPTTATSRLIVDAVLSTADDSTRTKLIRGIVPIGVTVFDANRLVSMKLGPNTIAAPAIFEALLGHPDLACQFLERYPYVPALCSCERLINVLSDTDDATSKLRQELQQSAKLPSEVMAWNGDPVFLPILERRIREADAARRPFLQACARACGAEPTITLKLPRTKPMRDTPEPRNALGSRPDVVCLTGRIVVGDGQIPVNPRFNDGRQTIPMDQPFANSMAVRYDAETGRFVFLKRRFSFCLVGVDLTETSLQFVDEIAIEADNAQSLQVALDDDMPDLLIQLEPSVSSN